MQVTNNSKGRLILSDGTVLDAGQTVEIEKFDDRHHVTKAWLDAGMIETAKAASKPTKDKE